MFLNVHWVVSSRTEQALCLESFLEYIFLNLVMILIFFKGYSHLQVSSRLFSISLICVFVCYLCSLFFQSGYTSQGKSPPSSKSYEPSGEVPFLDSFRLSGSSLFMFWNFVIKSSSLVHRVADGVVFKFYHR